MADDRDAHGTGRQYALDCCPVSLWLGVPGYKLQRLLGTGVFGRVFQGKRDGDGDGDMEVAIKVVGAHSSASQCLENEVAALTALKGVEGVPQIVASGSAFLVMKPVGKPLPTTAAPMTFTRKCAMQLFEILKRIHHHGYAHGDVRPANIVYHGDGIMLVDYGGAQQLGRYPDDYVGTFTTASDSILDALVSFAKGGAMPHVKPVDDVISAVRTIALFTLPGVWAACRQVPQHDAQGMKDFWASLPQLWKDIEGAVTTAVTGPGIYDAGKRVCDTLFEKTFGGDLAARPLYPLPS